MANDLIPITDIQTMAAAIAKSGLFGIKTPDQAFALMLLAQAEGRHPATVARDYDIIQGRPAKRTEAMLRDFIDARGKVEWHQLNDVIADATFSHPQGGTIRITWDFKRATTAGLGGKDMWKKYPRQMLRNRVISEGVRTVCPSATSGMYEPGEVQDFTPIREEKPINAVAEALGDWDQQHPEEMESLRNLGALLVDMIEVDGNPRGAYEHLLKEHLDSDQMLALWKVLGPNSKTRSALKKQAKFAQDRKETEVLEETEASE